MRSARFVVARPYSVTNRGKLAQEISATAWGIGTGPAPIRSNGSVGKMEATGVVSGGLIENVIVFHEHRAHGAPDVRR